MFWRKNKNFFLIFTIFLILGLSIYYEIKTKTLLLYFNITEGFDMFSLYKASLFFLKNGLWNVHPIWSSRTIYPDLMSIFLHFSADYNTIIVVQIILMALMAYMIYHITYHLTKNYKISLLSLILLMLAGPIWVYSLITLREFLSAVLLIFIYYTFTLIRKQPTKKHFFYSDLLIR